jgi:hypothetical protein
MNITLNDQAMVAIAFLAVALIAWAIAWTNKR